MFYKTTYFATIHGQHGLKLIMHAFLGDQKVYICLFLLTCNVWSFL